MYKSIIFIFSIITFAANAKGQTISLTFPYFAGKTSEFKIVQGNKQIVLQNDTIPKGGKVQLTIPEKYKGYKGMAMWYITNTEKGGGLEMVINNENFSVTCLQEIPTTESIIYKDTKENTFANNNYKVQQDIFAKHDAMLFATRSYSKNDPLYPIFKKEYENIKEDYNKFVKELQKSPLYAARFREITNLTMGIGTIITEDENLKAQNINDLIVNKIDYDVLYTSNHWGGIINNWVQLQTMVLKNDEQMIADAKTILNRLPSNLIYTEFVLSLTKELTKAGKDNIIAALTNDIKNSNKLQNYEGVLNIYQKDLAGKAPNLVIKENTGQKTTIIDFSKSKNNLTLLVFYKSGCAPCDDLISGLQSNYKSISSKGVEIITVSADTNQEVFQNSALKQSWTQKYCDFEGTDGINFKNYAVIGTPTLYLINQQGNIIRKMYGLKELSKILEDK